MKSSTEFSGGYGCKPRRREAVLISRPLFDDGNLRFILHPLFSALYELSMDLLRYFYSFRVSLRSLLNSFLPELELHPLVGKPRLGELSGAADRAQSPAEEWGLLPDELYLGEEPG
jgi:hypothetical protein